MRKANPQTHQACRSLLQKAIRRGDTELTRRLAFHLQKVGDSNWLKTRTSVILFEECWPLGAEPHAIEDFNSQVQLLTRIASAEKRKDAAGLGALGYVLSTGDTSVFSNSLEDQHLRYIADAIKGPVDFWSWAIDACSNDAQRELVRSAHKAYRKGGWPWDRAFMQAASYLAVKNGVPDIRFVERVRLEVPYWVGLDKHTPQGKEALLKVAKEMGVPVQQVSWVSFYLEGALANDSADSYWWSRECTWRLKRVGLDGDRARSVWERARPLLIAILKGEAELLKEHLDDTLEDKPYIRSVNNAEIEANSLRQNQLPGFE